MRLDKCARHFQWCIQGLVLAYSFFSEFKIERQLGSGSLGYRDKAPMKNLYIYIQRAI